MDPPPKNIQEPTAKCLANRDLEKEKEEELKDPKDMSQMSHPNVMQPHKPSSKETSSMATEGLTAYYSKNSINIKKEAEWLLSHLKQDVVEAEFAKFYSRTQ